MKLTKLLIFLLLLFVSNSTFSQERDISDFRKQHLNELFNRHEERISKRLENYKNNPEHHHYKSITDYFLNFEKSANRLLKTTHNQDCNSNYLVDSIIVTKENEEIEKHSYTYDANGNKTSELSEYWDGSNLVYNRRITCMYDSNENNISKLFEEWDGNQWVNDRRNTLTYDSDGNMTSDLGKVWDGNQWVNDGRNTSTYDSNGNKTSRLFEEWDGNQWVNNWRFINTYDLYGNQTMMLLEEWDGGQWRLLDHGFSFEDSFGRDYSFSGGKMNVFYSTFTNVEEPNITITNFSLSQNYPNPFNPSTTISYSLPQNGFVQLKVYDMLGREVVDLVNKEQKIGNYKVKFNAKNLSSGVYLYRLQSSKFTESKKLILLR